MTEADIQVLIQNHLISFNRTVIFAEERHHWSNHFAKIRIWLYRDWIQEHGPYGKRDCRKHMKMTV